MVITECLSFSHSIQLLCGVGASSVELIDVPLDGPLDYKSDCLLENILLGTPRISATNRK